MSGAPDAAPPDLVGIVGGGPAGLTLARVLDELSIPWAIFERAGDFGGLWNPDSEGSAIYDSAHLISSRSMTGFDGYPMPEAWPDYPRHDLVLRYIRDFAREAGLYRGARFGAGVETAVPDAGGWRLRLSDGTGARCRWLVCANGATSHPHVPVHDGDFDGVVRHAMTHRAAQDFAGKRVLVVGGGNSGADIACDAAAAADFAALSLRRGYHVIPKHILGKPADVFAADGPPLPLRARQWLFPILLRLLQGDLTRLGLPRPDHRLMETHPLVNDQMLHHLRHGDLTIFPDVARLDGREVAFADGRRAAFDEIILATGYEWHAPYVDEAVLPMDGGGLALPLRVFAPKPGGGVREDLFCMSFIKAAGSSITLFHDMAWIIARAIAASRAGRGAAVFAEAGRDGADMRGGLRMLGSRRHAAYVERDAYLAALRGFRRRMGWPETEGCRPIRPG